MMVILLNLIKNKFDIVIKATGIVKWWSDLLISFRGAKMFGDGQRI